MGLIDYYNSPCDKTWTGKHTTNCGHEMRDTMDDEMFYWMHLDRPLNTDDLQESLRNDELFGIVSEKDGGIIAYAIGIEHADLLVEALIRYPTFD